MKKHNTLYYIFLWDFKNTEFPSIKVEQIFKRIIDETSKTVNPKQHSPPKDTDEH